MTHTHLRGKVCVLEDLCLRYHFIRRRVLIVSLVDSFVVGDPTLSGNVHKIITVYAINS